MPQSSSSPYPGGMTPALLHTDETSPPNTRHPAARRVLREVPGQTAAFLTGSHRPGLDQGHMARLAPDEGKPSVLSARPTRPLSLRLP